MKKRNRSIPTLIGILVFCAGCQTVPEFIDYTKTGIQHEKNPPAASGAIHNGFRILPSDSGSAWIPVPGKQTPNRAYWTVRKEKNFPSRIFTAVTGCTDPLPEQEKQEFPITMLKRMIEHEAKKTIPGISDIKIDIANGRRNNLRTVEYFYSVTDSRHIGKKWKLFIAGFALFTSDDRILICQVAERVKDLKAVFQHEIADEFFNRVVPSEPLPKAEDK